MFHRSPHVELSAAPAVGLKLGRLACSAPSCAATNAVQCSYVDRRQRQCDSAWCRSHQQVVFNAQYCRRHAGIIEALGADYASFPLPDLENRAPSLANWIGRDLDSPIRELLAKHFPGHPMQVSSVVNGGGPRERVWGRSWKLFSATGVDLAIGINVPESDDTVVRVTYDASVLAELTPPWIEARREGVLLEPQHDYEARRRFYGGIIQSLDAAILGTKAGSRYRAGGL